MSEDKDSTKPATPTPESQDTGANEPTPADKRELSVEDEEAKDGEDVKGGHISVSLPFA